MAEKLNFTPKTDQYGNTYGEYPPTNTQLTNNVNELIDEVEQLRSKISELEERIDELEWKYKA